MVLRSNAIELFGSEKGAVKYSSTNLVNTATQWKNCKGFIMPEGNTVVQNGCEGFFPLTKRNSRKK